jgi:hypothetical protein
MTLKAGIGFITPMDIRKQIIFIKRLQTYMFNLLCAHGYQERKKIADLHVHSLLSSQKNQFTAGNPSFLIHFCYSIYLCKKLNFSLFVPGTPAGVQGCTARGMRASAARDYHLQDRAGVLHPHSEAVQACSKDCLRRNSYNSMNTTLSILVWNCIKMLLFKFDTNKFAS